MKKMMLAEQNTKLRRFFVALLSAVIVCMVIAINSAPPAQNPLTGECFKGAPNATGLNAPVVLLLASLGGIFFALTRKSDDPVWSEIRGFVRGLLP